MAMLTRGGLYLGLPAGTTEPQTGSRPTGGPRPDWHHMISRARPSPAMSATARRQGGRARPTAAMTGGRLCPARHVRDGVVRAAQVTGPPLQPQGSLRDRCATACGRP